MTSRRTLEHAERMLAAIAEMEAEYRSVLIAALRTCAAGRPGLFGRNEHIRHGLRARPPVVNALSGLADEIDRLRKRSGMRPFALRAEFEASRGRAAPDAPGEAKQAQDWLKRLEALVMDVRIAAIVTILLSRDCSACPRIIRAVVLRAHPRCSSIADPQRYRGLEAIRMIQPFLALLVLASNNCHRPHMPDCVLRR